MSSLAPEKQAELRLGWSRISGTIPRRLTASIRSWPSSKEEHELVYQLERKYAVAPEARRRAVARHLRRQPSPARRRSRRSRHPLLGARTDGRARAAAARRRQRVGRCRRGHDFTKVQQRAAELDEERARIAAERDKLVASLRMLQGRYETQRNTAGFAHEHEARARREDAAVRRAAAEADGDDGPRDGAREGRKGPRGQLNARGAQVQSLGGACSLAEPVRDAARAGPGCT